MRGVRSVSNTVDAVRRLESPAFGVGSIKDPMSDPITQILANYLARTEPSGVNASEVMLCVA